MKKLGIIFLFSFFSAILSGQVSDSSRNMNDQLPATTTEEQLENITQSNEDNETEDDSYLQEMVQFQKNPVNLNTADEALLKELFVLSPLQIQNLLLYRSVFGKFISIYELQAVPGWNIRTIQKLLPYVTVNNSINISSTLKQRLQEGQYSILTRASQVLERSKGYLVDSKDSIRDYLGSPLKLMLRYKYVYKNLFQYGIVAEKDAGEQFFKGRQKQGFDFYSFHVFLRNLGIIKSLAIGDFTVNLGQGLTQWQSLAFKKGPDVLSIKRQSAVLRPYNSAAEVNFNRGIGITIGKKIWQATLFGSFKKIDANFNSDSTDEAITDYITSLQISGYHRTKNELDDKGVQRQLSFGGNFGIQTGKLHAGINFVQYNFKYPLIKADQAYNQYALNGKSFGNYSIDYSYTFKNLHFFGEAAFSDKGGKGYINGMILSVSNNVDLSLLYRNISRDYQALYSNAFTENSTPNNEKGFYTGISIRPANGWQIDAYYDFYSFPWLKYRVDAPTTGADYMAQVYYRPNKQLEIYTRYKKESKSINFNPNEEVLNPQVYQPRQNWRTQLGYKINSRFTIRSRTEMVWFDKNGNSSEEGFLIYADLFYKPPKSRFSGNLRLQYFETEGYNSRLYAYESDVLFYFSIPVFYDKGYRYYININYDFSKKIAVWAKWGQFLYSDKTSIGSGLDEISGNKKSEFRIEALYRF